MITEKSLTDQLLMAAYVVEVIQDKAGLHDLASLVDINESLEKYIERLIGDLTYDAEQHDPSHGIDSKWLYDLIDEIKAERA